MTHLPATSGRVAMHAVFILTLTAAVTGCGYDGPAPLSPSIPVMASTPAPSPAPPSPPPPSPAVPNGPVLTARLSGIVFEMFANQRSPIAGVELYCDACGTVGHTFAGTDATGAYDFGPEGIWLSPGRPTLILVRKDGYDLRDARAVGTKWTGRDVAIDGEIRFDFELTRR